MSATLAMFSTEAKHDNTVVAMARKEFDEQSSGAVTGTNKSTTIKQHLHLTTANKSLHNFIHSTLTLH